MELEFTTILLALRSVDQLITLTAIPPAPLVQGVSLPVTTPQNYLASRILFRRFRIDQSRVPGKAVSKLERGLLVEVYM